VEVARRAALPVAVVEAPFVGTFPTFLIGDFVVKFFGPGFDGPAAWAAERAMHELLAFRPDIPAPALIAAGALFDDTQEWRWPYLVTQRLRSWPVRERPLAGTEGVSIAAELGQVIAALHSLAPPDDVAKRNLVPQLRSDAAPRLSRFGLPQHLVEQVPEFLRDAPTPATLVHADITADHLFHDGRAMTGIIDWGDSVVADPFYELVALAFDCFDADHRLLEAFLLSYDWEVDDQFVKNAMQAVCEFQFNAVTRISSLIDLHAAPTLDAVAEQLFGSFRT
jgi:aminoglycoside phosphotransferase (APT) family kinase protein